MIKIDFEKTSEDGVWIYRDAIHLPDDHTYSKAYIEELKQSRFERWLAAVTAPPIIEETTAEDIIDVVPAELDIVEVAAPIQE
jgi:hypothetical protein